MAKALGIKHMAGSCRLRQAFAQECNNLAVLASALALIFKQHHLVECIAEYLGLLADVLVSAIPGATDDDRASRRRQRVEGLDQCRHGVGVVAIVGDDGGAAVRKHVEAASRIVVVVGERGQGGFNGVPIHLECPRGSHAGHDIFDLKAQCARQGDGNAVERDVVLEAALRGDQIAVFDVNHGIALRPVGGHDGVVPIERKEGNRASRFAGHGHDVGVGGVEHGDAVGRDVLNDDALEYRQFIDRGDVVQAQVVAAANVGDDGDIALVKGQPFAQDAAACRFQHGSVDVGVQQNAAGTFGAAAVTGVDALTVDIDAIGVGHAHPQAAGFQQVGNQAHGGGLAVGAGYGNHRDTTVLPIFEQRGNDGVADRTPFAEGWRQVHAQARGGVDFNNPAALLFQWSQDAVGDDIDAANIEAHHVRCRYGTCGDVGVDVVRHVGGRAAGGEVGIVAQINALSFGRDALGVEALRGQAFARDVVETYFGQRR